MSQLPERLQQIVDDFSYCEGPEKLEFLLEFAEKLPPLPDQWQDQKDRLQQVHECITPIFIQAENEAGVMRYHFDVPAEAPTVRGFASVLYEGLYGLTAAEILAVPDSFHTPMALQTVISGQRMHGMSAILHHMKNLARPFLA